MCCSCLQVISPSSEHLFQTLNEQDLHFWTDALQKTTAEALQKFETSPQTLPVQQDGGGEGGGEGGGTTDIVPNAMVLILAVPGNKQCADCTSTGEQRGEGRGREGERGEEGKGGGREGATDTSDSRHHTQACAQTHRCGVGKHQPGHSTVHHMLWSSS